MLFLMTRRVLTAISLCGLLLAISLLVWLHATSPARAALAETPWRAPWWGTATGLSAFDLDPFPQRPQAEPRRVGAHFQTMLAPIEAEESVGFNMSEVPLTDSVWAKNTRRSIEDAVGPMNPSNLGGLVQRAGQQPLSSPILHAITNMPFHGRAGRFAVTGAQRGVDILGSRYTPDGPSGLAPDVPIPPVLTTEGIVDLARAWLLTAAFLQSAGRPSAATQSLVQGSWVMALWARSAPDHHELAVASEWGEAFVDALIQNMATRSNADHAYIARARARWDSLRSPSARNATVAPWQAPKVTLLALSRYPLQSQSPLSAWWYQHLLERVNEACGTGEPPRRTLESLPGAGGLPRWVKAKWDAALTPSPNLGWWARHTWCTQTLRNPPWRAIRTP